MKWENILKVDEERWKRYREQRKKEVDAGKKYKNARKPTMPKYKCAMCGLKLSKRGDTRHETSVNTGLSYCKRCATHRDKK